MRIAAGLAIVVLMTIGGWSWKAAADGIDLQTHVELSTQTFLQECRNAVGVAVYVGVSGDAAEHRVAEATCVAGECPKPVEGVLSEAFLREFFAESCCMKTGWVLYVAFSAEGEPSWTYLPTRPSSATLTAECIGDSEY